MVFVLRIYVVPSEDGVSEGFSVLAGGLGSCDVDPGENILSSLAVF